VRARVWMTVALLLGPMGLARAQVAGTEGEEVARAEANEAATPILEAEPEIEEAELEEAELEEAEPVPEALPDWLDGLTFGAFADVYGQGVWTLPDPFSGDRRDVLGHRPYEFIAGLTLSFVGLDVQFEHEQVGARIDLRFGTSTPRLLGPTSGLPDGMQFVKQAFVTWRPADILSIDFGQFDTIYGAEVSESWRNHTYSRGALYQLVQPFYHTGFRVSVAPIEGVTVTALAVNGWNNVLDDNDGKTFGAQASWSNDQLRISAGYLTGPEGAREGLWRHFGDLVVALTFDTLEILGNANYIAEDVGEGSFDQLWGAMISGRLRFPPLAALALRGEVIGDPDAGTELYTATFTVEVTPIEELVLRVDNRLDVSSDDRFQDPDGLPSQTVFSTILGVVVHTL
jgi:hypothetical protein